MLSKKEKKVLALSVIIELTSLNGAQYIGVPTYSKLNIRYKILV